MPGLTLHDIADARTVRGSVQRTSEAGLAVASGQFRTA
jgi:hypothetical protein